MEESSGKIFVKRVFGFSMASWINCLISLVSTPITTALFAPAELGKINLFISYANIFIPFVYLGFDQAYIRFFNEPCGRNNSKSLFRLCLNISIILTLLVSVFILFAEKTLSSNIVGYESFSIALCLVLYLLATMFLRYTNLKARMENNILSYSVQAILSTIIIKISFVLVAFVKPEAGVAIEFRSLLLFLLALIFAVKALINCRRSKIDKSYKTLRELSKYAIPLFPTVFLVMLNLSLSQIFLKKYVDYSMLGIYSNAVTIAGIISILQSGLNAFWTPFVFEYYKEKEKIQKMHHTISFLLIGLALGITLFQDVIYFILVNEQYWASKAIMPLLLISPVCETISETLGLGIEISKKTYLKIPVYLINISVNVLSCIILIPHFGVVGAAAANALASLSMLVAKTIIGEHYYKCSDNYLYLISGMSMLIGIAMLNYFIKSILIRTSIVLVALVVLCIVYKKSLVMLLKNIMSIICPRLMRK